MRRVLGGIFLVVGGIPFLFFGPQTIIWAIHECPYIPSNCYPIPYRVIVSLTVMLAVALTGLVLLIGGTRRAKKSAPK